MVALKIIAVLLTSLGVAAVSFGFFLFMSFFLLRMAKRFLSGRQMQQLVQRQPEFGAWRSRRLRLMAGAGLVVYILGLCLHMGLNYPASDNEIMLPMRCVSTALPAIVVLFIRFSK